MGVEPLVGLQKVPDEGDAGEVLGEGGAHPDIGAEEDAVVVPDEEVTVLDSAQGDVVHELDPRLRSMWDLGCTSRYSSARFRWGLRKRK